MEAMRFEREGKGVEGGANSPTKSNPEQSQEENMVSANPEKEEGEGEEEPGPSSKESADVSNTVSPIVTESDT